MQLGEESMTVFENIDSILKFLQECSKFYSKILINKEGISSCYSNLFLGRIVLLLAINQMLPWESSYYFPIFNCMN